MLSCEELRAELSNLVDGDISSEVRQQLEHHLAECRACHVLYDSMHKTIIIVTESSSFELPDVLARRIRGRIMDDVRARRRSSSNS